jgi:lysyl-tRNA synthetase, class II
VENFDPNSTFSEDEYFQFRLNKLEKLREAGVPVYIDRFPDALNIVDATSKPEGAKNIRTAGRLIAIRKMGKLVFAHIQDISGRIQVALRKDGIGEEDFERFKELIDIGDFIGVEGDLFLTRTGELTIDVKSCTFLGKSLHPLPEKWHGLTDTEMIYRRRYLDLIMSEHARKKFLAKSKLIQTIREMLLKNGFIEVETPVLQARPSGAAARPFMTHHNTLDMDVALRIAPETYLKRLIVGGFTRVFEFARCFRNEGISPDHLQDFTMLEYYVAYWSYRENMAFTENLIHHVLDQITGSQKVMVGGREIDFSGEWPVISFHDLIQKDTGIDLPFFRDAVELRQAIANSGIDLEEEPGTLAKLGRGNLIDLLYKRVSRPKIIQPMFLVGHPVDLSPLARASDRDPSVTDRFQLVAGGTELVNAYSELADPLDQKRRFELQAALKAAGDEEAMEYDDDFVMALEHGMPPTSGWGMGIDRFMKFLFDEENIKNCVLFPLMRSKK